MTEKRTNLISQTSYETEPFKEIATATRKNLRDHELSTEELKEVAGGLYLVPLAEGKNAEEQDLFVHYSLITKQFLAGENVEELRWPC